MTKFLAMLLSVFVFGALAQSATVCQKDKRERKVELVYKEEGKKVPCEVKYTTDGKDGKPEEKIVYSAEFKEGFCEEKVTSFIGKLNELGWHCAQRD